MRYDIEMKNDDKLATTKSASQQCVCKHIHTCRNLIHRKIVQNTLINASKGLRVCKRENFIKILLHLNWIAFAQLTGSANAVVVVLVCNKFFAVVRCECDSIGDVVVVDERIHTQRVQQLLHTLTERASVCKIVLNSLTKQKHTTERDEQHCGTCVSACVLNLAC